MELKSFRIQPIIPSDLSIEMDCDCGKKLFLYTAFGGHPTFCGNCEKAYYLRAHDNHFHIETKSMNRQEILQESYGHIR